MPSIFTLEGTKALPGSVAPILARRRNDLDLCRETTGYPIYGGDTAMGDVTAFLTRQGYFVGGLLALAMSLAIGGVVSIAIVTGLKTVGVIAPTTLSGAAKRRRRKAKRK